MYVVRGVVRTMRLLSPERGRICSKRLLPIFSPSVTAVTQIQVSKAFWAKHTSP